MKKWSRPLGAGMYLFALLGILFIPFPFYLFEYQEDIASLLFAAPVARLSALFFNTNADRADFSSDAPGLYALLILLAGLALVLTAVLHFVNRFRRYDACLVSAGRVVCTCYLSLQLLKYGFDKLFKAQFYLPEPNTLYTPVGQLGKDILFWTMMGTSWSFNVFTGLMELIPAVLLLFKRTRVLGLLLATGVLSTVLMIDLSFGISVKLYAGFLLFLSFLLLSPYLMPLYDLLIRRESVRLPEENPRSPFLLPGYIKVSLKTFVIGMLFLEALYPFLLNGNFNDDLAPRPPLHGAYEVRSVMVAGGDTLQRPFPVKRFFIHRRGYLIFQDEQDGMQDFKLSVDTLKGKMFLTGYDMRNTVLNFEFAQKDSILELQYPFQGKNYKLVGKALPWKSLPALRDPN